MDKLEQTIEIECPADSVFRQWTRFDEFSKFMPSVIEVTQTDRTRLHWRVRRDDGVHEWESAITRLDAGKCVAWTNVSGPRAKIEVYVKPLTDTRTLLQAVMSVEPPPSDREQNQDYVASHLDGILNRFKCLMEERHCEVAPGPESHWARRQ